MALAITVSAGFTAPMLGKKLLSTLSDLGGTPSDHVVTLLMFVKHPAGAFIEAYGF
jgi:hypothetical protein